MQNKEDLKVKSMISVFHGRLIAFAVVSVDFILSRNKSSEMEEMTNTQRREKMAMEMTSQK